jgi:hypothetical protein
MGFAHKLLRRALLVLSTAGAMVLIFPLAVVIRVAHLFFPIRADRLFIGLNEIANIIQSVSDCLSERNVSVHAEIISNVFYEIKNIRMRKNLHVQWHQPNDSLNATVFELTLPFRLIREIIRNDTFLFIWNRSFMPLSLDYFFLRLAGKRLLLMHCGDDVRYRPMQRVIDAEFDHKSWPNSVARPFHFLRSLYYQTLSETFASVISHPDQSTFQTGPLFHFRFPQRALIDEVRKSSVCPLILHCPSDRIVKRTDIVLKSIDHLREEGLKFEFELIENSNNEYVLERMKVADIVVDQPGVWVARLAMEAMAAGCCVVGGNRAAYMQRFDSPVIQFEPDPNQLAAALKELIVDYEFRQKKMNESFEFWKSNYSYEAYAKYFNNVIEGTAPTFMPRPNQKQLLLNGASSWLERAMIQRFYFPKTVVNR